MNTQHFVGIDVSQNTLDICILPDGELFQLANNSAGIAMLKDKLSTYQPKRIVLEATGGLEREVQRQLETAGYSVARVNPRHPRAYGIATGQRAKTDRLDALVLAQYASSLDVPARALPSHDLELLQGLVKRRDTIKRMIADEKKRLVRALEVVKASINGLIGVLEAEIKNLNGQIKQQLEADASRQVKAQLLQTVPGVGFVTSSVLISSLPELGSLSTAQVTSLAGLAPFARDSGKFRGQRFIGGGRVIVRCALFMAAVTARQHNSKIKALYERLKARGKAYKVCIVACARELLVMLNAMVKSGKPFDPLLGARHT